jgi:mannose-6-phosphate isomerase
MVFVDAGTVHAIGPGVTLLEVQQTCDVTYRLYDYGRPRELHLEQGLAVVKTQTRAGLVAPKAMDGFTRLIDTEYFVVDRYEVPAGASVQLENPAAGCLVGLSGSGLAGDIEIRSGQAVVLPQGKTEIKSLKDLVFAYSWEPAGP